MNKQVPSLGKILVMVSFALLCFVLLLWLWLTFGGSTPLKANGYRFTVPFGEATQLAREADVRIAGVNVGKVKDLQTNKKTGLSIATIQMQPKFAPIPVDTRVTLRQKTILGETYVQLSPGSQSAPVVPEGGSLARRQVVSTVELDEILNTFDPKTRKALSNWIVQQATAFDGRSRDVSELLANLPEFEDQTGKLLETLNSQSAAVQQLSRSTGEVLGALTQRDGQLQAMIRNSNRVFGVTARRNDELVESFKALPTFERELTATTRRLSAFAKNTDPVVQDLIPAAKQASPTLVAVAKSAPDLEALMRAVPPLVQVSEKGLPATTAFIKQVRAFLPELSAPLSQLAPVLDSANLYRNDVTAFLANTAAATNLKAAVGVTGGTSRVVRITSPLNPEGLSLSDRLLPTTRQNAYPLPLAGLKLASGGLDVYDSRACGGELNFTATSGGNIPEPLLQSIIDTALAGGKVESGKCEQQPRFDVNGTITRFPQVRANPAGLQAGPPVP